MGSGKSGLFLFHVKQGYLPALQLDTDEREGIMGSGKE